MENGAHIIHHYYRDALVKNMDTTRIIPIFIWRVPEDLYKSKPWIVISKNYPYLMLERLTKSKVAFSEPHAGFSKDPELNMHSI